MSFVTKKHMKSQSGSGFKTIKKTEIPVVHKRQKLPTLTHDEGLEMHNIIVGGLMRKITHPVMESKLLDGGFIRRATGGLVETDVGHRAFLMWQNGGKK